jgi:hypothetical protein
MPSGTVQFFNGGSASLGTAPLKAVPATENFLAAPISGSIGNDPYGFFTLPAATSGYSVLGVLDYTAYDPTTGISNPQLTIYSGQGSDLFKTSAAYPITNSGITSNYPGVDAFAVGDFNHDGVSDVLIHGYNSAAGYASAYQYVYYVLPGTAGGKYDLAAGVVSTDKSGLTCACSNPTEVITVDDFNGDGYPDVAFAGNNAGSDGLVGVALNAGAAAPANFNTFVSAPSVPPATEGESFVPAAIASGHFTSSGLPDIVITGLSSTNVGYVALYLNLGTGSGALTFATPTVLGGFATGSSPSAIATASFRGNGLTDVVVGTQNPAAGTGTLQVLFGDGKGGLTPSSTIPLTVGPSSVVVTDFNNDGFPDIVSTGTDGSLLLFLNDGKGNFSTGTAIGTASNVSSLTAAGDFNGDGLADIAEITRYPLTEGDATASALEYLNSASSQAALVTAAQTLPAGTDNLTAVFPANNNFTTSTSPALPVTVTQTATTLTWPTPAAIEYGIPLGSSQLNATASVAGSISYAPAAGAILPPGTNSISAAFVPADTFDYTGATATQSVTVTAPTLSSISPTSANLGDPNTTLTVAGQGFVNGAQVLWDGTALATTWVSLNQLTAVVPASLLTTAGKGTVTVVDPSKVAVGGSQTFTVLAGAVTAKATAPATVDAGQNSSVTLAVNPYPAPITATLTLSFAPDPPNTVSDPAVLFPNNTNTDVIQIPANSTAAIPAIDFSTGSTAGTITLTVKMTAGGVDVTPASLGPVTIAVPAGPPVISSTTLTRDGHAMSIAVLGLSPTRDMTQATFQFTAAPGKSLKTTSLTVSLTTPFTSWYQSATSDAYGTTFLYTQPFTLDSDSDSVGTVTVTLTNSQGSSQPSTTQ